MRTHWLWLALGLGLAVASPLRAEQTATVTGDRVNVRGKASLNSEVVTQLSQGDTVTVLEEIPVPDAKAGEPSRWAKIQLPAGMTVFVFAPYIDTGTRSVKVSRLNLRGGPGENFSVLGRIPRGTPVKEVQTTASWMEIQAPEEAYAFVAMNFLKLMEPIPSAPATPAVKPDVTAPTPVVQEPIAEPAEPETVEIETAPVVLEPEPAAQEKPRESAEPVTVQPTVTMVPPAEIPEESPPRMVYREGRVVVTFSVQAPSKYALMSLENKRLINYLHTEKEGLNLKAFAGKKVLVFGEELLDERWVTPLLEVDDISLAP